MLRQLKKPQSDPEAHTQRYTFSMTTTIKVSSETRDLLKSQASRANLTLGGYLHRLAQQAAREERFDQLRRAIEQTSAADAESYAAETAEWEQIGIDGA